MLYLWCHYDLHLVMAKTDDVICLHSSYLLLRRPSRYRKHHSPLISRFLGTATQETLAFITTNTNITIMISQDNPSKATYMNVQTINTDTTNAWVSSSLYFSWLGHCSHRRATRPFRFKERWFTLRYPCSRLFDGLALGFLFNINRT